MTSLKIIQEAWKVEHRDEARRLGSDASHLRLPPSVATIWRSTPRH